MASRGLELAPAPGRTARGIGTLKALASWCMILVNAFSVEIQWLLSPRVVASSNRWADISKRLRRSITKDWLAQINWLDRLAGSNRPAASNRPALSNQNAFTSNN